MRSILQQWPGFHVEIQIKKKKQNNNMKTHMITVPPDKRSPCGVGRTLP